MNKSGITALDLAAFGGYKDLVLFLLENNADVEGMKNLRPFIPEDFDKPGDFSTPLFDAATEGHCDVMEILIKSNANVNSSARYMKTPLHTASEHGKTEAVKILLKNHANASLKDIYGHTPADISANDDIKKIFSLQ
ncbi:MAG: hypothetical protein A2020_14380 [Lentisphaerae bacterium GWF2_45_14]|nr:MAG: hypothetical protein A2020_14380 [Lentisphaerae bacterium GWF2_45_14]